MRWIQFNKIRPIDGDRKRDNLLAMATIYLARAAGNSDLEMDDLLPDPFDSGKSAFPGLDPAIIEGFAKSR